MKFQLDVCLFMMEKSLGEGIMKLTSKLQHL